VVTAPDLLRIFLRPDAAIMTDITGELASKSMLIALLPAR
jgi:hypothetical protein